MKNVKISILMGLVLFGTATSFAMNEKNPYIVQGMFERHVGKQRGTSWKDVYYVLDRQRVDINDDRYSLTSPNEAMTLLGWAVYEGNVDAARTLIEKYGANPNVTLFPGQRMTPLSWAQIKNDNAMVQMLRQHGAQ